MASRAYGVVTRAELVTAGVTPAEIASRLRSGALVTRYRGVYRVGHRAPSVEADYMAAVKACGEGALLSGLAAAYLYRLVKASVPAAEVLVPESAECAGPHRRFRRGPPTEATTWRGIPITTVPRTLVDLAALLSEDDLARACHEAGVKYRTTPRHVDAVLVRHPNSKGTATLRRVMSGETRVTLSKLEARFLALLREAGLPLPLTNRPASGRRVDCRWPEQRLTVELDSYTFHNSRYSWEKDRQREREARARGDEFRRYSRDDVFLRPDLVVRELRELLARLAPR